MKPFQVSTYGQRPLLRRREYWADGRRMSLVRFLWHTLTTDGYNRPWVLRCVAGRTFVRPRTVA